MKNLLFYPEALQWMWNYCIYLGSFTNSKGENYDLGIYIDGNDNISAAIVYDNTPGSYLGGGLKNSGRDSSINSEVYEEVRKRINFDNLNLKNISNGKENI